MRVSRDSIAAILAAAAVVIVVSLGFWKTRGPGAQRLVRADEKRIQNLSQLANEINNHYKQHNQQLPADLHEDQKRRYKDPLSDRPVEYFVKTASTFTLCADFSATSPDDYRKSQFEFWEHPAGRKCFDFNAGEPVPQAPYAYYY